VDSRGLRQAFLDFFTERGHTPVPSAPLVSPDPTVMFTIAGMVPFKSYFLAEEPAPWPRAASVQRCLRTVDIELVGTTARHLTFFEMLGNFSFGDYFKAEAIRYAWEFLTERLGIDPSRLWSSVHESDEDAYRIWTEEIGLEPARVQPMGDDNFWSMGEVGPCGPSSEIYFDRGQAHGPGGGPARSPGDRYVEIWNLVFMQFNRQADRSLVELPSKNIDTGAGLERILPIVEGVDDVFDTDVLAPLVQRAESLCSRRLSEGGEAEAGLKVMADHARAMAFLVADGVFPSNDGRGYVLRRLVRRAVLRASQLGADGEVTPALVRAVVDTMGPSYPELAAARDTVAEVVAREERSFLATLRHGSALLEEALEGGERRVPGELAFRLHDTYGFPIELTREIAQAAGAEVDVEGFEALMAGQRQRARQASRPAEGEEGAQAYRQLLERHGPTEFVGYEQTSARARVVAVRRAADGRHELFLDRTPFYAEGGGQVGDTGTITTPTGRALVEDTTSPLPGVIRHLARLEGEVSAGQPAEAVVDRQRRDAIRRNHTGTHLLHWALREVLGSHVKQQGSLVAPDRLRFDFSHFAPVSPEELRQIERLVNEKVISDEPVRTHRVPRQEADRMGAIAFFGDKYGEVVRVVEAGSGSVELCGGTHVSALGMIGPFQVVSEGSIGANTRRIEAVTGEAALERIWSLEDTLERAAGLARSEPAELPRALERMLARQRQLEQELKAARGGQAQAQAAGLAARADSSGLVVERVDGLDQAGLRDLAVQVRAQPGVKAVVLAGSPDGRRVALVAAVPKGSELIAADLLRPAAQAVGGGVGRGADLAVSGGPDVGGIERALEAVRRRLAPADGASR